MVLFCGGLCRHGSSTVADIAVLAYSARYDSVQMVRFYILVRLVESTEAEPSAHPRQRTGRNAAYAALESPGIFYGKPDRPL